MAPLARLFASATAERARRADERPEVLYLRSFDDDKLPTPTAATSRRPFLETFSVLARSRSKRASPGSIRDAQRIAVMPVLCSDGEVRRFAGHLLPIKGPHGALAAIAGIYCRPSDADKNLFA